MTVQDPPGSAVPFSVDGCGKSVVWAAFDEDV